MKRETVGTLRKLAILPGLLAAFSAHADETTPQGYVMTVFSNMAHGGKILDGSSGDAIADLSGGKKSRPGQFENQINLCVAYAKTKQIDKAVIACDFAIDASDREARRIKRSELFGRESARIADTGRAIALTNRGVLHALTGELERARELFESARKLRSRESSAELNLGLLSHRTLSDES